MMRIEHLYLATTIAFASILGACATAPVSYQSPVSVTPPTGSVGVTQAVNIFDASGSQSGIFSAGKATLESIVAVMPSGRYQAGNIHFGGYEREATGISGFNRSTLASAAKGAAFLQGTTPIYSVIEDDLAAAIGSGSGKAAVVLISDGLATDYAGRSDSDARTIEAARQLAADRSGAICFHTVQNGADPAGAALLTALSNVTSCGSFRNASSLSSASALQQFSRNVYLGGAPAPAPRAAPAPRPAPVKVGDADSDGVIDTQDSCPNTLRSARVDSRGCWTLRGLRFASNSDQIEGQFQTTLSEDVSVLRANPGVRISVDGHTDSDGSEAYNEDLSLRRATSVRNYFVSQGLDASRFTTRGFGETRPIVPNDSRENKRLNRRVELSILN